MSRTHCPPSRRGHTWREATLADLVGHLLTGAKAHLELRVCRRCAAIGRISSQGIVHVIQERP